MSTLLTPAPGIKAAPPSPADGHFYILRNGKWEALHKDGESYGLKETRALHEAGETVAPSVTGTIGVMRKFQLEEYAKKAAARAARDIKPEDYASEDEWIDAVLAKASNASRGAMDLGSAVHKAFENAMKGREWDAQYSVYVNAIMAEVEKHGILGASSEEVMGSAVYGAAGTCDLNHASTLTIADVKTRGGHRINKRKPSTVPAYESDWIQTGAYGMFKFGPEFFGKGRAIIFAASTIVPGLVTTHVKQGPELREAWDTFLALAQVWRHVHRADFRRTPKE